MQNNLVVGPKTYKGSTYVWMYKKCRSGNCKCSKEIIRDLDTFNRLFHFIKELKQNNFHMVQFALPSSKTFLISSISNCYVHWSWYVRYRITVTTGYVVMYIRDAILQIKNISLFEMKLYLIKGALNEWMTL